MKVKDRSRITAAEIKFMSCTANIREKATIGRNPA
jgi:hypothetical protein